MTAITHAPFAGNAAPPRRTEPRPRPPMLVEPPERLPAQRDLFDDIPIDDVYYVEDGCAACMLGRVMLLTFAVFVAGVAWAVWG